MFSGQHRTGRGFVLWHDMFEIETVLLYFNGLLSDMENEILDLFETFFGVPAMGIELLPASGSSRKYYRIREGERSYIGVCHRNIPENRLFIRFTEHFRGKGLHVPAVYCVSADESVYIQEDLGDKMLLDVVEQTRKGEILGKEVLDLYRKALSELLRFQLPGGEGLDYSQCVPRPVFDRRCILWDLNYFKYCFLRLAGVDFSEQALEEDFEALIAELTQVDTNSFMFRDFQSRNIMVKDGEVWFIDYQGGRQGALQYDVASLLYDAIVQMPDVEREELLDFYIHELQRYRKVEAADFRRMYYRFVLIRLLQAMGAFGLRGLHERKQHFIDSIVPGLQNILSLFVPGKLAGEYPTLQEICRLALQKMK